MLPLPSPPEAKGAPSGRLLAGAALAFGLVGATCLVVERATGSLLAAVACLLALSGLALLLLARALRGNRARVGQLVDAVERLARGQLEARLDPAGLGELAPLAAAVNQLGDALGGVVGRSRPVAAALEGFPERFAEDLRVVARGGETQQAAIEQTASLLADIKASIHSIDAELGSLSGATEEASSSMLEMSTAVDEVARTAGSLNESVDSSTTSIHQISASIRQVAGSVDSVQGMAEETATAITQMDRAIQEVSEYVREASVLTERVNHEAQDGSRAVTATTEGIESIRSHALGSREVLERLAERIGEIGEILNVIGEINDETNLLSLNAAIIAAQAGEQGKAFAVVAQHVKTLAQRTASSTQEIERLIRAVQQESTNVVHAMSAGIDAVEVGFERSRRAGEALETIRTSAHEASSRVAEIARAAAEQTRNSKHVADAAQRTSAMVQQITSAMADQQRASEQILSNAEAGLELCRQVHRSTEEQRKSGRFVSESITSIAGRIRSIRESTESHSRASEAVAEAMAQLLEEGRRTSERLPSLFESLDDLQREAQAFAGELSRFR